VVEHALHGCEQDQAGRQRGHGRRIVMRESPGLELIDRTVE
jgi:hypothetical protein